MKTRRRMETNPAARWLCAGLLVLTACAGPAPALSDRLGDFYVSPRGDDRNPGTRALPFATLPRARDAVRKRIAVGLQRDVVVRIHGGVYLLPQGVTFGPEDSGTEQYAVRYVAYGDEVPVLLGGVRLQDWQPHRGRIYVAALPKGVRGSQLFEDRRRMTLARTPNEGYFKLVEPAEVDGRTAFVYGSEDLDPARWDLGDAKVNLWPNHDWFNHDYRLIGADPRNRRLVLDAKGVNLRAGNRYYVKNVPQLLDIPGECAIAATEGKVYAWPRGPSIRRADMVLSTARSVIRIQGQRDRPVRNLHFEGLDIGICEENAVDIGNAEDCSVRFCRIENAGVTGVMIRERAQRITVYGNEIRDHGQHGVSIQGIGPGRDWVSHHNVVENNHIHHCGRLIGHGYGVRISQSGHNRIIHNHIHHMPRYGVSLKGARYGTIRGKIEGMTWENRYDFMPGCNNLIAYNDIHHTNLDSQDTGAIESWGSGRDNVIDHNRIHDTGNDQFNLQSGIYLDDQADYWTVTNNIIYGVVGTEHNQCIYAKGIGNHIENNILVGDPVCDTGIHSFFMADERCDHHVYRRNIFYFEPGPGHPGTGQFGRGVAELHPKGTTLTWTIDVPVSGRYALWMRYACQNEPYGYKAMDGRTAIRAGDAEPVVLNHLPDTGDWGRMQWARTAELALSAGRHTLRWENLKGGGINMDALVLSDDPAFEPDGTVLPAPAADRHVIVVQAEDYTSRDGRTRPQRFYAYGFTNWSEDRLSECDNNLFHAVGGEVTIKGGPADKDMEKWRQLLGGRLDAHSITADPRFADVAGRDFSLSEDSPALELGFEPIDTSAIGLKPDFPERFKETDPSMPMTP
ncbi:MAG TPA: hypothetical protein ENN87_04870 [Phycisphaerales bacterium]|nr:hypothetical protein [Phycisphaerales bacterium]